MDNRKTRKERNSTDLTQKGLNIFNRQNLN